MGEASQCKVRPEAFFFFKVSLINTPKLEDITEVKYSVVSLNCYECDTH